MTVRRIPFQGWLDHCRNTIAQLGCREVGGLTVTADHLFVRELTARANPIEPAPDASSPDPGGAHPAGGNATAARLSLQPAAPRVAQPNWAALGLGSADEAEGRN